MLHNVTCTIIIPCAVYLRREVSLGNDLRDSAPLGVHTAVFEDLVSEQFAHRDVNPAVVALKQHLALRSSPAARSACTHKMELQKNPGQLNIYRAS